MPGINIQGVIGLALMFAGAVSFLRGAGVLLGNTPPKFERFRETYGHPRPRPRKFGVGDGLQVLVGVAMCVGGYLLAYGYDG